MRHEGAQPQFRRGHNIRDLADAQPDMSACNCHVAIEDHTEMNWIVLNLSSASSIACAIACAVELAIEARKILIATSNSISRSNSNS